MPAPSLTTDERLVAALRAGDEAAFLSLVDRNHAAMVRLARLHVPSIAVAEEVAQETWLAVLTGLDRFEGRSSLRTWIFQILLNRARTRGRRERRSVPFSSLRSGPAVVPARFQTDDGKFPGHWVDDRAPVSWGGLPEERMLSDETLSLIRETIERLPPNQRDVVLLRDVEGWRSDEVSRALDITPGNQRVLLHRARSAVRAALEGYFRDGARA